MRFITKSWATACLAVVTLTAVGAAIAQEAGNPGPARATEVRGGGDVNLSPQDMLSRVRGFIPEMEQQRGAVAQQLADARKKKDVVKALCLDDKVRRRIYRLRRHLCGGWADRRPGDSCTWTVSQRRVPAQGRVRADSPSHRGHARAVPGRSPFHPGERSRPRGGRPVPRQGSRSGAQVRVAGAGPLETGTERRRTHQALEKAAGMGFHEKEIVRWRAKRRL